MRTENVLSIQTIERIKRYCAFQDRSEWEVRRRMQQYQFSEKEENKMIDELKEANYIDDYRFTKIYVKSKVGYKQWGKRKIREELSHKRIDPELIEEFLDSIPEEEYLNAMRHCIRKWSYTKVMNPLTCVKLYRFLFSKGYEPDLIKEEIKNFVSANE
ncbi:MAG: recombination regulator RecX [Bacteroidales bacterium]|jgi:regulatory protein|nr:recombination regulator RecX [Bacteroidales bacterium]